MFEQLNFRVNFNGADYSNTVIPEKDKVILKELARQVAEIAARPVMGERKILWKRHNMLERVRPVILCDPENGWNEIIVESMIQCTHSVARHWEDHLRKQIFWGNEMNDDYVVESVFKVPYVYRETQWGVAGSIKTATEKKTAEQGKAYHIETVLEDYNQIPQITKPQMAIDHEATKWALESAHELFDGILDVQLNTVWFWSFGLTDDFAFLRGMENMMYDFYDEPDKVHDVMEILSNGMHQRLDWLEENRLLCLNNDDSFVGSGGMGFIDELPGADFKGTVKTQHMWGLAESQITVGVSPAMFEEFIFPYHKKLMERFGLTCYGCCEPMDQRFDIVKSVKNLRRVSVSPWANMEIMAEKLQNEYVYSWKPSPSHLAVPVMDEEVVRQDIRKALNITRNNRLEMVMKDNHTLGKNPENIKKWVRIAREEMER